MILLGCNASFAAENLSLKLGNDYLITCDDSMDMVSMDNPSVLTISPFFTIYNEKNVLLLHPKKAGKVVVRITLSNKSETIFGITVEPAGSVENMTTVKKGVFEIILLDLPPDKDDLKKLQETK